MPDLLATPDGRLVPVQQWRLELPPDVSLEDVIEVLNRLQILYTGACEADLFRQFGPMAVYFHRVD